MNEPDVKCSECGCALVLEKAADGRTPEWKDVETFDGNCLADATDLGIKVVGYYVTVAGLHRPIFKGVNY